MRRLTLFNNSTLRHFNDLRNETPGYGNPHDNISAKLIYIYFLWRFIHPYLLSSNISNHLHLLKYESRTYKALQDE